MPADRSDRLTEVVAQLLSGATKGQLLKFCLERWGVSKSSARRYIDQATARVATMPAAQRRAAERKVAQHAHQGAVVATAAAQKDAASPLADVLELYRRAGAVPVDNTLEGATYMHKIMLLSVEEIVNDVTLTPAQRRDELRKTAARVSGLVDFVDLDDAKQRLQRRDDEIDDDRAVTLERTGDEEQGSSKEVGGVSEIDQEPIFTSSPGRRSPRGRGAL